MKRNIISGILAVLIALGLWLYVVTVVNPEWEETFYDIPVVFTHTEILETNDRMLIIEEEPKVNLRLSGNRTDMIKLNSSNIQLQINVANLQVGEYLLDYTITYPDGMSANAFEIVSQTPQQIPVKVVERGTVEVNDIRLTITNVAEGYKALENEAITQQSIKITGPQDVVGSIKYAEITYDANQGSESVNKQLQYVLKDENGKPVDTQWLTITPEQVECNVIIRPKLSKDLTATLAEDFAQWNTEITYFARVGEKDEEIDSIVVAGKEDAVNAFIANGKFNLGTIELTEEEKTQLAENKAMEITREIDLQELFAGKMITTGEDKYNTIKVVVKLTPMESAS